MSKFIVFLLLFTICALSSEAQISREVLRELLDLPSPPPRTADPNYRPASFFNFPPPDDAPIEDLLIYWKNASRYGRSKSSPAVALRLIDAVETDIDCFKDFITKLPDTDDVGIRVRQLYESKIASDDVSDEWRDKVKRWLTLKTDFFVDDLVAASRKVRDNTEPSGVLNSAELAALADKDWNRALPLLENLRTANGNPRTSVFTTGIYYRHAVKENDKSAAEFYRGQLVAIVEDRAAKGDLREIAFNALTEKPDWSGFDDWFLSLLADGTIRRLATESGTKTTLLNSFVRQNPEKWIPALTNLVGDKDPVIHNAAVDLLLEFDGHRDALEPLLPWLTDRKWTDNDLKRYIKALRSAKLPDCVPGLINILLTDEENAAEAARSLSKYKDPRANSALFLALNGSTDKQDRISFVQTLFESDAFDYATMLAALENYAILWKGDSLAPRSYPVDYTDDTKVLPVETILGKVVLYESELPDEFVKMVFERIGELQKTEPVRARYLLSFTRNWNGSAIEAARLRQIADGKGDLEMIASVLADRIKIRNENMLAISWLTNKPGPAFAIGLAIYEDSRQLSSLIADSDPDTKIAALAAARLLRIPLPVQEVAKFLGSPDELLAIAADRYLESEDRAQGREFLLSQSGGTFRIVGARDCFFPAKTAKSRSFLTLSVAAYFGCGRIGYATDEFKELDAMENRIQQKFESEKDLLEVFATRGKILSVYPDRAVLRWEYDKAYFYERILSEDELTRFRQDLVRSGIAERAVRIESTGASQWPSEFIVADRRGGRRTFHYGEDEPAFHEVFWPYTDNATAQFHFSNHIGGAVVLAEEEDLDFFAIWKSGNDLRLLVKDERREKEIKAEIEDLDRLSAQNSGPESSSETMSSEERKLRREYEHFNWRSLIDGTLSRQADEPAGLPFLAEKAKFPSLYGFQDNWFAQSARVGGFEIRADDEGNLWRVNATERFKIIGGNFSNPVVTPDGKWVVAKKYELNGSEQVVRIHLASGREFPVKAPSLQMLTPLAFLGAHRKMILRDGDPEFEIGASYYLLDVETGVTTRVKGEFRPLGHQTFRALQTTGRLNEFWAAIYDGEATEVGVYNEKEFKFKARLRLPKIALNSMDIWVNEPEGKIYLVYTEESGGTSFLVSVPLPVDVPPVKK